MEKATFTSKTEHTDNLLRLNTENIESSKPDIPNLFCIIQRPYRIFFAFETNDTEQTEHTEAFLRLKRKIPKICYKFFVVFVRSSQLG